MEIGDKLFFEWQDQMRYEKKQIEESLIRGIKQASRGELIDLGSFAKYVNEPDTEMDGN